MTDTFENVLARQQLNICPASRAHMCQTLCLKKPEIQQRIKFRKRKKYKNDKTVAFDKSFFKQKPGNSIWNAPFLKFSFYITSKSKKESNPKKKNQSKSQKRCSWQRRGALGGWW